METPAPSGPLPPNLRALTDNIAYRVAQWQTVDKMRSCYAGPKYTRETNMKNLPEAIKWLEEGMGDSMLLTIDLENQFNTPVPQFLLLGNLQSKVLVIKLANPVEGGQVSIPDHLSRFLNAHILVGAGIEELRKIGFLPYYHVCAQALCRSITGHPACPWENLKNDIKGRTSLKHIPNLLYDENYGSYNKEDWDRLCKKYPHPQFKRYPNYRHPLSMYRFKWPMTEYQLAYCRNDAMSPLIQTLVLALLQLSEDRYTLPKNRVNTESLQTNVVLAGLLPMISRAEGVKLSHIEEKMKVVGELVCKGSTDLNLSRSKYPDAIPDLRDEEEECEAMEVEAGDLLNEDDALEAQATCVPGDGEWKKSRLAAQKIRLKALAEKYRKEKLPSSEAIGEAREAEVVEKEEDKVEIQVSLEPEDRLLTKEVDAVALPPTGELLSATEKKSEPSSQDLRDSKSREGRQRERTRGRDKKKNRFRTPSPTIAPKYVPSMVFVPSRNRSRSALDARNAEKARGVIPGSPSRSRSSRRERRCSPSSRRDSSSSSGVFGRLGPPPKSFGTVGDFSALQTPMGPPVSTGFKRSSKKGSGAEERKTSSSSTLGGEDSGLGESFLDSEANSVVAEARAFAYNGSMDVIVPNRFRIQPKYGSACNMCGRSDPKKHHTTEDCPLYKGNVKEFGKNTELWPPRCTYKFCSAPHMHKFPVCPGLHKRCLRCEVRGHDEAFCGESLTSLREAYEAAKRGGYCTKKKDPQWNFEPPSGLEKLKPLKYQGKTYLVDWNPEQYAAFYGAPEAEGNSKASKPNLNAPKNKLQILNTEIMNL